MRFSILIAAAAWAAPAHSDSLPLSTAASAFGTRSSAITADLSPDGSQVVYIAAGPGRTSVAMLLDVAAMKSKPLVKSSGNPESLDECGFVNSVWIICSFSGVIEYQGILAPMSRTVAIDVRTSKIHSLTVKEGLDDVGLNQFDGRIIDWLPDEDGAVLMQRNYVGSYFSGRGGIGVDRIQIDPLRARAIEQPRSLASFYLTDGHGDVRFLGEALERDGDLTGESRFSYRLPGKREWRALKARSASFSPITIDRTSNSLFFMEDLDGRSALYTMKLDGSESVTKIASNPLVDIDGPIRIAPGEPVVGYSFTDDRHRVIYTDPDLAKMQRSLAKALPKAPLINVIGASKDRQKLLISASGDTDSGAIYVFDRKSFELTSILEQHMSLLNVDLAPMEHVTIRTRDGKSIPAYVTTPIGSRTGPRPAVVLPHGGPSARDEWGYEWIAQFLAARGYLVIQPNFRGSAGFGNDFLGENAIRDWRAAMSDIADSADWLVKNKSADGARLAIVGWSYGGYAALQSASLDPRYKAVVAIAPVTDFKALRRQAADYRNARIEREVIGKGDQLDEGSPINGAAKIKAPVLLVHGTMDVNVRVSHSQKMAAALRKAGKPVEFLSYKGLEHQLDDTNARVEMLTKMGELLEKTIGQ